MSDLFIFLFGCFVTMIVAGSVGLLVWGAANEPEDGEFLPEERRVDQPVRVLPNGSQKVG